MLNNKDVSSSPESFFYDYQKKMEEQLCQVCQNFAVGFHYGAYVCEACKKFFKRYHLNHNANSSCCTEQCDINRAGRRKCADCRFKKCLSIGMELTISPTGKHPFDISKIPCRICGSKSSGFHFGSLTCEGCKGFFRRAESMKDRLTCSSNGECFINFSSRSMCKYCRYQQCLKAGMSKTGSRIGRQSNAVKHHCVMEIASNEGKTKCDTTETTYPTSESSISDSFCDNRVLHDVKYDLSVSTLVSIFPGSELKLNYSRLTDAVSILQMPFQEAMTLLKITRNPLHRDQTLLEVWTTMMHHFDVHSHMLIQFAKKIPAFNDLSLVDKRSLVQESMYPIILMNLARSYDHGEERFNYFDFSEQEYQIILFHFPSIHMIMSHVMNISRVVHNLRLSWQQIGIFCAMELFKNHHNLESAASVKTFYDQAVRLCWASVLDQFMDSAGPYKWETTTESDIVTSLRIINCPGDIVEIISRRISMFNTKICLHKLKVVFLYFPQWLQKYNIEHRAIIDKLKVNHPELPYSELYVDMFQLSAPSTLR